MSYQYLKSLTWLRAFAAFFVVVSHSIRASEVSYSLQDEVSYFFPISLLDLGTFGVYLFFALSGCTLYISNHKKINSVRDFFPFTINRFFRIWPTFAISLIIYLVFIEFFRHLYTSDETYWIAQFLNEYSWADVIRYLSLTFNITGPNGLFIGPYWSLPVEFQYYLLLPFLLILMKIKSLGFISPLIFSGTLYYFYQEKVFDINRDEIFKMGFVFFGGVMLAKYREIINFKIPFAASSVMFFIMIILTGMVKNEIINIPDYIPFISDHWNFYGVMSLLSVLLALITEQPSFKSKILDLIHQYGTISYSIYLFHMLFLGISVLLVIKFEIYGDWEKQFFITLFTLIFSYLFSKITYKYIEKTFVNIGRRYSKKSILT